MFLREHSRWIDIINMLSPRCLRVDLDIKTPLRKCTAPPQNIPYGQSSAKFPVIRSFKSSCHLGHSGHLGHHSTLSSSIFNIATN